MHWVIYWSREESIEHKPGIVIFFFLGNCLQGGPCTGRVDQYCDRMIKFYPLLHEPTSWQLPAWWIMESKMLAIASRVVHVLEELHVFY